jgi:probable F420-dependent oxidoreductase
MLVEPRAQTRVKPATKMRAYLDRPAVAPIESSRAAIPAPVIVTGHGPRLMRVAAAQADGSFLFLQAVETVRRARAALGPDKELHVAVRCVLVPDPVSARALAHRANAFHLTLPAYQKVWAGLGFEERDWTEGSDRLIDAICAWGDAAGLMARLDEYCAAGATHVALYPCNPAEDYQPDSAVSQQWHRDLLEALAPG